MPKTSWMPWTMPQFVATVAIGLLFAFSIMIAAAWYYPDELRHFNGAYAGEDRQ